MIDNDILTELVIRISKFFYIKSADFNGDNIYINSERFTLYTADNKHSILQAKCSYNNFRCLMKALEGAPLSYNVFKFYIKDKKFLVKIEQVLH